MAILFVDSFSFGDPLHQLGRFTPFFPACKYICYTGGNFTDAVDNGPNGEKAIRFGSSAFNQHTVTKVVNSSPTFCLGFLYRPIGIAGTGVCLCRYEAGGITIVDPGGADNGGNSTTSLMLQQNPDGTLSVYQNGLGIPGNPGTLIYTTTYVVSVGQWLYIEFLIDTGAGSFSLYIDDVLIKSQGSLTLQAPVSQFSLQSFSFEEHNIANLYLTDGARLGPCRAIGFPPTIQSTHQWNPLNPPNLSQVQEFGNRLGLNTPDDNQSYVEAVSAGLTDLYGFMAPACFGSILAVALNADGNAISGSPSLNFLIQILGVTYPSGTTGAYAGGYGIQQGITQVNPATGITWTDADLGNSLFGFSLAGGGDLRVTQFFGEKLVSLRSVPFNCGRGNQSYTT